MITKKQNNFVNTDFVMKCSFLDPGNHCNPNIADISGALFILRIEYDSYCMSILQLNVKKAPEM